MNKKSIFIGFTFLLIGGALLFYSPNWLTAFIIALMLLCMLCGYLFCIVKMEQYSEGFQIARKHIYRSLDIQTDSPYIYVSHLESFFQNKDLDKLFLEFKTTYKENESSADKIPFGIEDVIDEDILSIKSFREPCSQLPGILTGLGLLGTFIGLIAGISNIGFSSVTTAVSSLQILLNGIRTAFYSSIAGVILSISFNMIFRIEWNTMLHNLDCFYKDFHKHIIKSTEYQQRIADASFKNKVLETLESGSKKA